MTKILPFLGIHGINAGSTSPQEITDEWTTNLRASFSALGISSEGIQLPVVYFADIFARHAVAQGEEGLDAEAARLLSTWAEDSISVQAQGPIEQWTGQVAAAIAGRLDDVPPWLVARLMRIGACDASDYLNDVAMRRAIKGRLSEAIRDQRPRVLIAHSLGSVVAWETLQDDPGLSLELLVTIGSPLATPNAILPRLNPQPIAGHTKPPGVTRWVNVLHPGDVVAAVGSLLPAFPDVDEEIHIDVDLRACHRASSYLNEPRVAQVLVPYI